MLTVRNLSKAYGKEPALHNVSLSAAPGDGLIALLGANGSGKSTLLRVLATAIPPDTGDISFAGYSYAGDLRPVRQLIGYLPQALELPGTLSAFKVLHYLARLKGVHDRVESLKLLDTLGLSTLADKPLSQLSSGQLRMVGIAQALIGSPRLLLLDECLRGLDTHERERVIRLLRTRGTETVTLFSSHVPAEVERMAARVIVLAHGSVLFAGEVSALIAQAAGCVYELRIDARDLSRLMQQLTVSRIQRQGDQAILRVLSSCPPTDGVLVSATLEDAYLLRVIGTR